MEITNTDNQLLMKVYFLCSLYGDDHGDDTGTTPWDGTGTRRGTVAGDGPGTHWHII